MNPPEHLKSETAAWWAQTVKEYGLPAHALRTLTLAAEAWDRCQGARETLESEGCYFDDRFGQPKAHPALAVERDSRIAFVRCVRELALGDDPGEPSRPPGLDY